MNVKSIDLEKPLHAGFMYGAVFGLGMAFLSFLGFLEESPARAGFTGFVGGAIGAYLASFIHEKIRKRKQEKEDEK